MKKILLIIIISISLIGCTSFVPREDLYEKAEFQDERIGKGTNIIELYYVEFPDDYLAKLEFLDDFELACKKMLLEDKILNLLASKDLYDALQNFKNGDFLLEEELFEKVASDLDEFERAEIDSIINKDITKRGGTIQFYLNKQVYFWMKVTGVESKFDTNKIYTELDKQRLMEEVRAGRKELFDVLNAMKFSLTIKVENPYSYRSNTNEYWGSKEIELFNMTGISRELQGIEAPLYIENLREEDIRNLIITRSDFISPILILKNDKVKGYTIRDDEFIFFDGGNTIRGYYRDYDFIIEVMEIPLASLINIEEGVLLEGVLKRTQVKEHGLEEVVEEKKQRSLDWGIE